MPTHKIANIRDAFLVLPPSNEVCEGYVFTSVCHSVHRGGCLSQCMLGYTPPGADTPSPRSRNPPGADTAWYQTPQEQTPPKSRHTPRSRPPLRSRHPLHSACREIRATKGRYASFWNAYLVVINSCLSPRHAFVASSAFIFSIFF